MVLPTPGWSSGAACTLSAVRLRSQCAQALPTATGANRTGVQNPHPRILSTCRRGELERVDKPESHQMSKSRSGEFWTSDAAPRVPDEFRLTWRQFCPTPGAKFTPFRPTATRQSVSHKRLARARWGEINRISPHDKKEKNFAGAKLQNPFAARTCGCRWAGTEFAVHPKALRRLN